MSEEKIKRHAAPLPRPTQAELLVIKAQRLLAEYSALDSGISEDQVITQLFELFDGPIAVEVFTEVMERRYRVRRRGKTGPRG